MMIIAGGSSTLFSSSSSSKKKSSKTEEVKLDQEYPWGYSYRIRQEAKNYFIQQKYKNLKYEDIYSTLLSLSGAKSNGYSSEKDALAAIKKVIEYEKKGNKKKEEKKNSKIITKAGQKTEGRNLANR